MPTDVPTVRTADPSTRPLSDGRDELNLAEFPISVLQRQQPKEDSGLKRDTIVYESSRYDPAIRQRVPQTVTLTTSSKYGLPTPADEDLVLALLHLAKLTTDFSAPEVTFTPHQVFYITGWEPNGRSYNRLRDVLRRLKAVTILYQNAWWDREGREYQEEFATGIIAEYRLIRQLRGRRSLGDAPRSWVRWTPSFFSSLQNGNLKRLDLERLFSLKLPTSRRMYRFLDKRFYSSPQLDLDLRDFACGHIGLSASHDTGELKAKLQPAINELQNIGFIKPAAPSSRYQKIRKGVWRIHFAKEPTHSAPALSAPCPNTDLYEQLVTRSVTRSVSADLVANFPADRIRQKIEVLDWLKSRGDDRVSKSPAGYLVASIRDDYAPPEGFKTKAEIAVAQKRHRQRLADARREAAEQKASEAADQARWQALKTYWDSLSHEEQDAHRAAAVAEHPHLAAHARRHPDSHLVLDFCFKQMLSRHPDAEPSS